MSAHDALGAKLVGAAGFDACYMTGNGAVASLLGVPDVGLASFAEMLDHARRMADAIDLPLICDADTGYGGSLNIRRTVRAFADAGSARSTSRTRCSRSAAAPWRGAVVPLGEARSRIRATLDARDRDILIIARTDAVPAEGLDRAIGRANAYGEEGADLVYIEMLSSDDDLAQVARQVGHPLFYDLLELEPGFVPTVADLERHGYRIVVNCLTATRLYAAGVLAMLRQFRETGDLALHLASEMDLHAYEALLGLPELQSFLARPEHEGAPRPLPSSLRSPRR